MAKFTRLETSDRYVKCIPLAQRHASKVRGLAKRFVTPWLMVVCLVPCLTLASEACDSTDSVGFICGIENAEDLIRVPNSDWLIASGRESAVAGTLYAVHQTTRAHYALFPSVGSVNSPSSTYAANCPGPIDQFQPHGISVRQVAKDQYELYVVGHGAREAIEIFELRLSADQPSLRWSGCISAPDSVERFNAVTALPGGRIAVTHLPSFNSERRGLGEVWAWSASDGWNVIPGGAISGANGIVAAPDGQSVFVSEYFSESLIQIFLGDKAGQVNRYKIGYSIDNIRWSEDGQLLLTAHERNCDLKGQCDRGAPGAYVLRFNPETGQSQELFYHPAQTFLPIATVVEEVDGALWMGGIRGADRIVILRRPARDSSFATRCQSVASRPSLASRALSTGVSGLGRLTPFYYCGP